MSEDMSEDTLSRGWLLYGAYGYTGRLLASEALRRGHRPILAGRNGEKLERLAAELAEYDSGSGTPRLAQRVFSLNDTREVRDGLAGVGAVFHAAGPFLHTASPMMRACLDVGAHYLDITGEVPVFEAAFRLDEEARANGVIVMPGVGMDVIPTDGVAAALAERVPDAGRLELALHSPGRPSVGTRRTIVEHVPSGLLVRRNGRLERANPGRREFRRWVDMGPEPAEGPMAGVLGGRCPVTPYTWGDLSTAYRTTGIGNLTCYMVTPRVTTLLLPVILPPLRLLFRGRLVRALARRWASAGEEGPSEERRRTGRVRVWGRVEDRGGRAAEAVLELPESYRFTAEAGVRAMEEVLRRGRPEGELAGTLTPAGAFGVEWVLGLPGVEWVREPTAVA